MRYGLLVQSVALSLLSLIGCGGQTSSNPAPTVPVTAVVTYQDQALPGAIVTFIADGGSYSSSGVTDAQGKAVMGTFGEGDGVVPGSYRVTVRKIQVDEPSSGANSADPADQGQASIKHLIPIRYTQANKSGLTATITQEGAQEVELSLSDHPNSKR